jgi:hypothetical protein
MTAVHAVEILAAYYASPDCSRPNDVQEAERFFIEYVRTNVANRLVPQLRDVIDRIDRDPTPENRINTSLSLLFERFLLLCSTRSEKVPPGPAYGFRYLSERCHNDTHLICVLRLVLKRLLVKEAERTENREQWEDDTTITVFHVAGTGHVPRGDLLEDGIIRSLDSYEEQQRLFVETCFDDDHKTVFNLVYNGYSKTEIAEILGKSTGSVEALVGSVYLRAYIWLHDSVLRTGNPLLHAMVRLRYIRRKTANQIARDVGTSSCPLCRKCVRWHLRRFLQSLPLGRLWLGHHDY